MNNLNKFLNPLFLIVGVPILFVVIVAIMVYLPSSLAKPQHDLVYMSNGNYYYSSSENFFVQDEKIQAHVLPADVPQKLANENLEKHKERELKDIRTAQFFIFNVETKTVESISFKEASELRIKPSSLSPDGYEFTRSRRTGNIFSFFFSGSNYGGYVLKKGLATVKLPINNQRVKFMGWIIN